VPVLPGGREGMGEDMIPVELIEALKELARPLIFGDPAQLNAIRVMEHWHEQTCQYCRHGINRVTEDRCRVCEGTGKVWVRT
jgi:hypothetical protein